MKVKVIRAFLNKNDIATEGTVIDVSTPRAHELEKRGLVVPTIGGGKDDPFPQRQPGGQTGAVQVVSSSPVAPVLEKEIPEGKSKKRKGGAKSSR